MNENKTIFSIDVDAHLEKAASHYFGSAGHYPVELVRAALRRGANKVDVQLTRERIRVRDDGRGLDAPAIQTLIHLLDPAQATESKEAAVESLQTHEGMGLLAIFAPNPTDILIETFSAAGQKQLHLGNKGFRQSDRCSFSPLSETGNIYGTVITLVSSRRDHLQEKKLLEAFCRSVPRDIRVNRQPVRVQPLLTRQLGMLKLKPLKAHKTRTFGGIIGIPRSGTICHLKLLDQAIPWHHFTLAAQKGFIFDAAVETTGDVTRKLVDDLCRYAEQLYHWLTQQYASAPAEQQDRIEELLFTHCRLTGDMDLLNKFEPFKVYSSPKGKGKAFNLAKVKELAEGGALYAVPRKKERVRYNTGSKTVLLLPREQADLLINHLSIPIDFLNPVVKRHNPIPALWYALKKKLKNLLNFLPVPKNTIPSDLLTHSERKFLLALIRYFAMPGVPLSAGHVSMVPGRGFRPVILAQPAKETQPPRMVIRRDNPLIRRAIRAVETDPRYLELFIPLFL